MEDWQKEIIKKAFDRCYGLQDILINPKGKGTKTRTSEDIAIETLAHHTCMNPKFIRENIEEIKKL
jgi:hypothetical protein